MKLYTLLPIPHDCCRVALLLVWYLKLQAMRRGFVTQPRILLFKIALCGFQIFHFFFFLKNLKTEKYLYTFLMYFFKASVKLL